MSRCPLDPETLKYFGSMGVGGALAGIIFLVYRKDAAQWQEAWKGQSQVLIQVVKENTTAVTALVSKLDRLFERRSVEREEP